MISPWLGIVGVLVALGALMLAVRAAQRRLGMNPELARKTVHMGMGLVCLSFPWLFRSALPVWILAAIAVLGLGAVRLLPALKDNFGKVLGGVQRRSWGEILFPLSVAFIFWLTRGDALLFCVPVLILSLADAVAALIGRRYGLSRYETDDGWKSIEGSTAFFMAAFLSTHVPLLLFSDPGRLESLLIAAALGLILVLIEAIAWHGLDNLFIPVVSYVCLTQMIGEPPRELTVRVVVLATITVLVFSWRKATRLTQSAVIGTALILYVTWAVGDWHWFIAPVVTAVAYTFLCHRPASAPQRHTIYAIACIGGLGLFWLALSKMIGTVNTIYAYGVGYGANLAMIALAHFADSGKAARMPAAMSRATALSFVPLAVPYLIVWRENPNAVRLAIGALALVAAALGAFAVWQPMLRSCPADAERWTRQGVISAVLSALAFGLISLLEPWSESFL